MRIINNNNDRTILINSETNFGTDLGWEECFQEFEHETLKSIINPTENFETVRYIHSGYTSELGIEQHDIWHEFYFYQSNGTHNGGMNYEHIGLSGENNYKLLRTDNTSFFRLEFYKVPEGETPNSKNRKLVFTKQLPIPLGEQVYYNPISQKVYVPVFSGSNYRNSENMFLYWFQDDTVLEGTMLSGNTFYLAAKFYNTIDGTSIAFLNKNKNINQSIDETEDMYRKMVINRDDYSYVIYTGITEDHRGGQSTSYTPLKWYAGSISTSSLNPYIPPTPSITPTISVTPSRTPTMTPTPTITPSITPSPGVQFCYTGRWAFGDPVYPDGGRLVYVATNGTTINLTNIYSSQPCTCIYVQSIIFQYGIDLCTP